MRPRGALAVAVLACACSPASGWRPIPAVGAPDPSTIEAALWLRGADRLLVFGRGAGVPGGGAFDPSDGSWTPMDLGATRFSLDWWIVPGPLAAGTRMLLFESDRPGTVGVPPPDRLTGSIYDAIADRTTPFATDGAPSAREGEVVGWTGDELLIWGGISGAGASGVPTPRGDGARLDVASNTWRPMNAEGAPSPRVAQGVWTGDRLIVWGGVDKWLDDCYPAYPCTYFDDGAVYDPAADRWTPMSTAGAPAGRTRAITYWAPGRREMIVYGGQNRGTGATDDGGRYDPDGDTWTPIPAAPPLPVRNGFPINVSPFQTGDDLAFLGCLDDRVYTQLYEADRGAWREITDGAPPCGQVLPSADGDFVLVPFLTGLHAAAPTLARLEPGSRRWSP